MIRILLADDHAVVRTGVSQLLATADDLEVVGTAADGAEAVEMWREHRPPGVLMDPSMPNGDGVEGIGGGRPGGPDAGVVVVPAVSDREPIPAPPHPGA